jgi:hypothetical protein
VEHDPDAGRRARLYVIAGNSSLLILEDSSLVADVLMQFIVHITDTLLSHASSLGVQPSSTSAVSILILSPIQEHVVEMEAGVDPCAGQSLCIHGSCIPTLNPDNLLGSSTLSYSLSCACPTTPVLWYGERCSLAVLDCEGCVASYSRSSVVTLYGVLLNTIVDVRLEGELLPATLMTLDDSSERAHTLRGRFGNVSSLQVLSFTAPALGNRSRSTVKTSSRSNSHVMLQLASASDSTPVVVSNPISAYKRLVLRSYLPGSGVDGVLEVMLSSLLFYSSSNCLSEGLFAPDGQGGCSSCPSGGICPGGGRVWPQAGYWSVSEYVEPVRCAVPEACPGVDASSTTSSSRAAAATNTQRCSMAYAGQVCTECSSSYFMISCRCFSCGSRASQDSSIAIIIIVCLGFLIVLSLLVALLKATQLAMVMQV